jgi:uncharacterized protein
MPAATPGVSGYPADVDPRDAMLDAIRRALADRPEILEAYLFGSQARGHAGVLSDVDVAVYASEIPDAPFGYEAELGSDLQRALGRSRVDVVLLNRAPPLLYHRVLRDGVRVLSRDLASTTGREGRALSRFCDFVPQLSKVDAAAGARIARGDFGR